MTNLNVTPEELDLLSALPQMLGTAVAVAGKSGLFGTGREMLASGQALMEGVKTHPDNALIRAIVPDPAAGDASAQLARARHTRDWLAAHIKAKGVTSSEQFIAQAMQDAKDANQILLAKVDPPVAAIYRSWVLEIAEKVAMAATEGGFLGFGGTRLSDAEKAVIEDIRAAMA